ncbi:sensor histidine kinase [Streptomyces sp. NBC_01304]|uniref:sensor histidine kinase n=1 Tax=Streptomyces sp. NBC_01304 TaxID=2903818 RepID=UPI002E16113A|nr:histidine kinase [Streptomyces sp. NBC_01304]
MQDHQRSAPQSAFPLPTDAQQYARWSRVGRLLGSRTGDWIAIALVFLLSLPRVLIRPDDPGWNPWLSWPLAVSALGTLSLLMRRKWPEVPAVAGLIVLALTSDDALLRFGLYAVGRYRRLRYATWFAIGVVFVRLVIVVFIVDKHSDAAVWELLVVTFRYSLMSVLGPASAGAVVRVFRVGELLASFRARLDREEALAKGEAAAEHRAEQERRRIARDAHDHVGHEVTLMVLQANLLSAHAPDDRTREAAEGLVERGQRAIHELHNIVATLKDPEERAASPSDVRRIERLVEDVRRSGAPVRLDQRDFGKGLLPPAVAEFCFRVAQEGLTNAVKHAPCADIVVTMASDDTSARVSVRNAAPPVEPGPHAVSGGNGLEGLAELARRLGGELTGGATADGGFEVRATVPRRTPG